MADVTQVLSAIEAGDPKAAAELLPLVYDELRQLAAARLAREAPGQTLQPTALVHEAYLRLVGTGPDPGWSGRGHFFAAAAEAMRRVLVDHARARRADRRGGSRRREPLDDDLPGPPAGDDDLLDLDAALARLAAADPDAAEVVKLRVFAGLSVEDVAAAQGVSPRTVKRNWAYARAWLGRELAAYAPADP